MNWKKHSGTFVNVSDTAISYDETVGEQTIQKQDVRSVKLMENNHRLRNTLIAGAVGAGVGAVVGAAANHPCTPQPSGLFPNCVGPNIGKGATAGIGAIVGFAGGAIVGALFPSHKMIYNVNSQ
jgi:hypothetical protein